MEELRTSTGSPIGEGERQDASPVDLSVVIPVSERWEEAAEVCRKYLKEVAKLSGSVEILFVLDGSREPLRSELAAIAGERPGTHLVSLQRAVGEAAALSVGFERARGRTILTLPAYHQVEPSEVSRVVTALDQRGADLVIGWRHPRIDSPFNRWQGRVFHWLVASLTGTRYQDLSCGLRAMKCEVAREVDLYGDLHRFFPILAFERGFKVIEVPVRQSRGDVKRRLHGPGVYLRRMLDILTLFFLFKFTKKPLRFFGLLGTGLCLSGTAITGYLGLYRLLGLGGIAGRPLLILGVLLIVLGMQLFSIGLLGEIIIFTHGKRQRDYTVDRFLR